MKSLQTKLMVSILFIFLVAMCTLGGLNYWKARSIITADVTRNMQEMATTSASDVADWLGARKSEIMVAAEAPIMKSGKIEDIVPFLNGINKRLGLYEATGFCFPDGVAYNSAGVKFDLKERDYIKGAMQGKTATYSPAVSKMTGNLIVGVSAPIETNGNITGIAYGAMNMTEVVKKVDAIKVGDTGYAFVIQKDGLYIIHPNKELAMKFNALKDAGADAGQKTVAEQMVKGEAGIAIYSVQGKDMYYSYAPIPGTDWSLAINVPVAEVTKEVSTLTMMSLSTIVVVLIIAALAVVTITRRIVGPMRKLVAFADEVAAGDVSATQRTIYSQDEIGRLADAMFKMRDNLRCLITQVRGTTDQVAASSEELNASADQSAQAANQVAQVIAEVSKGAEKQLKAVNDAASIVAHMAASFQQIAANTNTVADTSSKSAESAQEGSKAVEKAIRQMESIEGTVTRSSQVVSKLGERSKEIGQIVDTISGIAGQTNLLALNAAIEAARAGEQGRGFAVVAEEVRKLAEQSQEAAKQIAELIAEIQRETDSAVVAMDEGTKEVRVGAEVVNEAGLTFKKIFVSFNAVTNQIKEISTAIQQMTGGSQQIVASVNGIDTISKETATQSETVSAATQEQSATMEEIAASSQALAKMAEELTAVVSKFKI